MIRRDALIGVVVSLIRPVSLESSSSDDYSIYGDLIEAKLQEAYSTRCALSLFEPNDASLREAVKSDLDSVMAKIRRESQIDQYKVVCDEGNNSPRVVQTGTVAVDVFWKRHPLDKEEYVFKIRPQFPTKDALWL